MVAYSIVPWPLLAPAEQNIMLCFVETNIFRMRRYLTGMSSPGECLLCRLEGYTFYSRSMWLFLYT